MQTRGSRYPRLCMTHGAEQEPYLSHKSDVLHAFISTPPRWVVNQGYGEWSCVVSTFTTPTFEFLLSLCYEKNKENEHFKKTVTKKWADLLTPRALAYWYMDDGTLQAKSANFMTHSFTEAECEILASRLREMGYQDAHTKPTKKNNKTYHLVTIPTEGTRQFLQDTRPYAHPSMLYKWEPTANYRVCQYCHEEFEMCMTAKPTAAAVHVCCAKVMCRRQMKRDQHTRHEKQRIARQPLTNARARAAWAAMPEEERQAVSRYNNAFRYSSDERRAEHNENKKVWRKRRRKAGIKERPTQQHTCQFCRATFENSATHKMGARSPAIYCPAPACLKAGEEAYKEIRRRTAREKWAKDRSATSSP